MHRSRTGLRLALFAAVLFGSSFGARIACAMDRITFITDYGFYGRHSYYFLALDKGYYKGEDLDVRIVRGPGSANVVKQVASGTAQLGFADSFAVILARANDEVPVKLVAMIYPKPPHALFFLKSTGVTRPKDLEGRTLADTAFSSVPKLFPAYAKAAGIDAGEVKWIFTTTDALPGLLAQGRVDGVAQFTMGEPLLAKAAFPKPITMLAYADAGLDFYSNGIIASDATIKTNPDLIRRFLAATFKGLKEAMAHPAEAAEIMHEYHHEVDVDIAMGEMERVRALVVQPGTKLGYIDPERMEKTIEFAAGAYTMKRRVMPAEVYAPGFVEK